MDSSKIEAKVDTWRARDKAMVDGSNDEKDDDGNPTMNNKNLSDYSSDPDARFISLLRMPFEGVFSRKSKRARFIGKVKTQFQAFMEALIFNTRRALVLEIEKIPVT